MSGKAWPMFTHANTRFWHETAVGGSAEYVRSALVFETSTSGASAIKSEGWAAKPALPDFPAYGNTPYLIPSASRSCMAR
jgi:hypothetical protein